MVLNFPMGGQGSRYYVIKVPTYCKVTEDVVSEVENSEPRPASHADEVPHVALDVCLVPFQTGHRHPGLVQRLRVKQTERSADTKTWE